jgi:uncharacterized DUF497 family protein
METRFTWERRKAERNKWDHGVSFETAREVFADPNLAIGMTRSLALVVVVFVDRSEPLVEVIHIISARKAVAYEQSIYEDQIG